MYRVYFTFIFSIYLTSGNRLKTLDARKRSVRICINFAKLALRSSTQVVKCWKMYRGQTVHQVSEINTPRTRNGKRDLHTQIHWLITVFFHWNLKKYEILNHQPEMCNTEVSDYINYCNITILGAWKLHTIKFWFNDVWN